MTKKKYHWPFPLLNWLYFLLFLEMILKHTFLFIISSFSLNANQKFNCLVDKSCFGSEAFLPVFEFNFYSLNFCCIIQ